MLDVTDSRISHRVLRSVVVATTAPSASNPAYNSKLGESSSSDDSGGIQYNGATRELDGVSASTA